MAFGEKKSFFGRLKEGLTKTKDNMVGKIEDVIFQRPEIDEDMMEELEETLIFPISVWRRQERLSTVSGEISRRKSWIRRKRS